MNKSKHRIDETNQISLFILCNFQLQYLPLSKSNFEMKLLDYIVLLFLAAYGVMQGWRPV